MSSSATALKPDGRTTRHEPRKGELLEAAGRYILDHGIADLSVRELAAGVGVSHRTLLYHFGSKEQLIMLSLEAVRERQQQLMTELMEGGGLMAGEEPLRAMWRAFTQPEFLAYYRLLFQVTGVGLSGPPYDVFIQDVMKNWLDVVEALLVNAGMEAERAPAVATFVHAAVRGFHLDLLLTGDTERVDAAFDEFLRCAPIFVPGYA